MSRYCPNAPPARNGVSASCVVVPPGMGPTVLDFWYSATRSEPRYLDAAPACR